jgi:hypothetical protein
MQFRLLIAVIIFVGSYLPLSLILLAQNYDYSVVGQQVCWVLREASCSLPLKNPVFALGMFFACVACFLLTLLALARLKPKHEIIIREAKHVPADLMNYTLPYVVSFMSIDYQEMGKFIGFPIFLGWMFWITYKSGQIILNPLLIVFGWRMYDVTYSFPGSHVEHASSVLAYGVISPGERHRQISVQDVLVIKNNVTAG